MAFPYLKQAVFWARRTFRGTPVQRLPIVGKLYQMALRQLHGDGDIEIDYRGCRFVFPADEFTILPSMMANDYETEELEACRRVLRPGDVVLDLGANVGVFSCILAKDAAKVIAVEPETRNFARLKAHVALNNLDNVECHQVAAGSAATMLHLQLVDGSVGTHHIVPSASAQTVSVSAVCADELVAGRPIRLVKLDVEGYEWEAIQGLRRTLEKDRPFLLVEFAARNLRLAGADPAAMLTELKRLYPTIHCYQQREPMSLLTQDLERTLLSGELYGNLFCDPNPPRFG